MAGPDPRKLKDEAAAHVSRGRWQKALENYQLLERLEPTDGTWAQRAGEMLRRLGKAADAVAAYGRAADVYSRAGFLLKAVAVCKLMLEIDPNRTEVQERLASLHAARQLERPARIGTVVAPAVPPARFDPGPAEYEFERPTSTIVGAAPRPARPASSVVVGPSPHAVRSDNEFERPTSTLVGPAPTRSAAQVPLGEVQLNRAVPGARKSEEIPAVDGSAAYEIPLGDEDIEISEDAPTAAETARAVFPRTPLFSSLDEARLRRLIERVELRRLAPGEVLFRRGDTPDALYVVASGEVAVLVGDSEEVSRLREGTFFGEIALLTDQPRSATIRAVVATELLVIARPVIASVIEDSPAVLQVLLRFMRDRLLEGLVETDPLFAPFSGPERRALAARFRFLEVAPGLALMQQGKRAAGLFIVLCGTADVIVDGKAAGELGSGGLLGQTSLLTGAPAPASVVARSKLLALALPRADFQEVIMTHPQVLEYLGALAGDRRPELEEHRRGAFSDGRLRVV